MVAEAEGGYISLSSTSAGNGGGTTVVATGIQVYDAGKLANRYMKITESGDTSENDVRRISSVSTSTITVATAFSAQIGSGVAFIILPYHPDHIDNAINRAIDSCYPVVYLPIVDESLVIDNLLSNVSFEEAISGGAHPNWTNVNSPTVTAETTTVLHGSQSAKIVSGGGGAGQMTQSPTLDLTVIKGRTATFKCWVWSDTASESRIRIDWDGSTIINSDYHTGDNEWRLLTVSGTVPDDATQVKAICEVVASQTGYFDLCWLTVGEVVKYTLPTSLHGFPNYISMQTGANSPNGTYLPFGPGNLPQTGRLIRVEGRAALTELTASATTAEIGRPQWLLVVTEARGWLHDILRGVDQKRRDEHEADSGRYFAMAGEMKGRPGVAMQRLGATKPYGYVLSQDADGRYLSFTTRRESSVE